MADIKAIKELALYAAKKQVPAEYAHKSVADVNEALRAELKELCGTYDLYRRNKLDLFEIMQETMNEVVPEEVIQVIGQFAEVRNYAHGSKPQFKVKKGKLRARKFATRAAASGVYETFRLDSEVIDVTTFAIGDAAYIDFERFLSGDEDWADYMEALMDGITTAIYKEIYGAMIDGAKNVIIPANKVGTVGSYDPAKLAGIIKKVNAYGSPVIVATRDFAEAMGPDIITSTVGTPTQNVSGEDIESIHRYGFVKSFRGTPVLVLPVSYEDETNTTEIFGGTFAFVLPSNGEKVVKVAMEGGTIVKDWENRDNSMEIQAYTKIGTAIITGNNWGFYTLDEVIA